VPGDERSLHPSGDPAQRAPSAVDAFWLWPEASGGKELDPPRARVGLVERGALLGDLASDDARLVLVNAPAGFGKTTLIEQLRARSAGRRAFAWVSLEPADNDPPQLWWHVVSAISQASPKFAVDQVTGAIRAEPSDLADDFLPVLLNELAALAEPVVLVLDDYHLVEDRTCHDQIAFLLTHLPRMVQIVMMTRADPPLPLARLRAVGEMVEVRARELRFTPLEAAQLVKAVADLELDEADLASLIERTEGWPAGIYLAALSLRTHPSPSDFIEQFTGENRFVTDFLVEEVLARQPAEIRQFLARTSILSRFSAPLSDAVTGSADTAEIIELLERENIFVVPLDDHRQWFRYNPLFAQVMQRELKRTEPHIVPALHERASAWHRQAGSPDEAIRHALAAADVDGVIDVIATHWYAYIGPGQVATVRGWLGLLGDGIVSSHPVAVHCAAWAAALVGDREALRRWLPILVASEYDGPLPDGVRSVQSSAALLQATFGFDGIGPMREAAAQAIRLETDPASPWYAMARAAYATVLYWCGDFQAAVEQAEDALASPSSIGIVRMLAFATLSLTEVDDGSLPEAGQLADSAREIAADADLRQVAQSSLAYTAVGAVYARRGLLTDARREFENVLQIRREQRGLSQWATIEVMLRLAPVLRDTGDHAAAVALLAEARQLLMAAPDGADAQLARVQRLEGQLAGRQRTALVTPLTDREIAVLRLLSGPLSLREIGQALDLSHNTIKTHTRAIYRKLGVSDRNAAIARGRDVGGL
jgi:LuxR family maltose regulon positive regulatory protein